MTVNRMHALALVFALGSLVAACQHAVGPRPPVPAPGPPGPASGPPAASSGAIAQALQAARDGDVVRLPAGTYAGNVLSGFAFAKGVTVTSADPAHPAVLTDLTLSGSSHLTFTGLTFQALGHHHRWPFQVSRSSAIVFTGMTFTGPGVIAGPAGLVLRDDDGVTVTRSDFGGLGDGINLDNGSGVAITANTFHDLTLRGVVGGGVAGLTISGNRFWNFMTGVVNPKTMLHPDIIYIWITPTERGGANIAITGNLEYRGAGQPVQGIMVGGGPNHPIQGVTVSDNVLFGEHWNGIYTSFVNGLSITGNQVTSFCDMTPSKIITAGVSGAETVTGNTAARYSLDGKPAGGPPAGNRANACVAVTTAAPN